MISVYNQSLICNCNSAEILRPQHFVVVCEHTSIHDNILSRVTLTVSRGPKVGFLFTVTTSPKVSCLVCLC